MIKNSTRTIISKQPMIKQNFVQIRNKRDILLHLYPMFSKHAFSVVDLKTLGTLINLDSNKQVSKQLTTNNVFLVKGYFYLI